QPHRQRRHVAGALRDRHHQPAPGLPGFVLGYVYPHPVGLDDLLRHDRVVPDPAPAVHPLPADDFDLGNAGDRAPEGRRRTLMKPPSVYGLLVEFEEPEALVEAIRKVRAAGYRKIDAFTPFPLEEV